MTCMTCTKNVWSLLSLHHLHSGREKCVSFLVMFVHDALLVADDASISKDSKGFGIID
jgi:hypothetical protein